MSQLSALDAKLINQGKKWHPHDVAAIAMNERLGQGVTERHSTSLHEDLSKTAQTIRDAEQRVVTCMETLAATSKDVQARTKQCVSTSKDYANQLSDQLVRIDKILGKDFEQRLAHLERFTAALAQLNKLHHDGKLDKLLGALK